MNNELYGFMRKIEDALLNALSEGVWQMKEHTVRKNNVLLHGISIIKEGDTAAPVIFVEERFKDYKNGESIENICEKIMEEIRAADERIRIPGTDIESILSRNAGNLIMQLADAKRNRELLAGVPHRKYMNLSVIYRIDVPELKGSILITDEIAKKLGLTETEIFLRAQAYTEKAYPVRIESIGTALEDMLPEEIDGRQLDEQTTMIVISYGKSFYGAAALMNKAALKQAAGMIGGDFYILPSSVHEILAVPANAADRDSLLKMVRMVNRTEVAETDVLTDSIYRYDRERGQLEVIEAEPERSAEKENRNTTVEHIM